MEDVQGVIKAPRLQDLAVHNGSIPEVPHGVAVGGDIADAEDLLLVPERAFQLKHVVSYDLVEDVVLVGQEVLEVPFFLIDRGGLMGVQVVELCVAEDGVLVVEVVVVVHEDFQGDDPGSIAQPDELERLVVAGVEGIDAGFCVGSDRAFLALGLFAGSHSSEVHRPQLSLQFDAKEAFLPPLGKPQVLRTPYAVVGVPGLDEFDDVVFVPFVGQFDLVLQFVLSFGVVIYEDLDALSYGPGQADHEVLVHLEFRDRAPGGAFVLGQSQDPGILKAEGEVLFAFDLEFTALSNKAHGSRDFDWDLDVRDQPLAGPLGGHPETLGENLPDEVTDGLLDPCFLELVFGKDLHGIQDLAVIDRESEDHPGIRVVIQGIVDTDFLEGGLPDGLLRPYTGKPPKEEDKDGDLCWLDVSFQM